LFWSIQSEEFAMKKMLVIGLSTVLLLGAMMAPTSFAAEKSDVTASEIFNPLDILPGVPVAGEFVYPGTAKCPGYEPTGNPEQPCPAGSRTHLRDTVIISQVISMDARMTGLMTIELNANWDADFAGPLWGTFSLAVDSGGTWIGTWQGLRERVAEDQWEGTLHVIGKGYGGIVDGMKVMAEDQIVSFTAAPIAYIGIIEGRIVDPN
jgi:hypothetical protein